MSAHARQPFGRQMCQFSPKALPAWNVKLTGEEGTSEEASPAMVESDMMPLMPVPTADG